MNDYAQPRVKGYDLPRVSMGYVSRLVSQLLVKTPEEGRQELSDLIQIAVEARQEVKRRKGIYKPIANGAKYGAAIVFAHYADQAALKAFEEHGFVNNRSADVIARYTFCEYRVQDYGSLEDLERAADEAVRDAVRVLNTFADGVEAHEKAAYRALREKDKAQRKKRKR
ncbi:hypothetical protein HYU09_05320 [Candidatus Woesearchaeota archaeon]|nr:hypothetical protein [Candidatus Woesearchaeota archaeon]